MEPIKTPTITVHSGSGISASTSSGSGYFIYNPNATVPYYQYNPYNTTITTTEMETEELWDFLWVYLGDDEQEEEFPHEGRIYGTKSDVEKTLLVEFARLYTDVDVDDYELKLRKW